MPYFKTEPLNMLERKDKTLSLDCTGEGGFYCSCATCDFVRVFLKKVDADLGKVDDALDRADAVIERIGLMSRPKPPYLAKDKPVPPRQPFKVELVRLGPTIDHPYGCRCNDEGVCAWCKATPERRVRDV